VLSLTVPSDAGTLYRLGELQDLVEIAKRRGLKVHVDGARLANALAALGCAPAGLTWRAGVDVLSLGAIKNGGLSADAIVTFDDVIVDELAFRTKRAGHVTSKMRFQSAQLLAYFADYLWLRLAGAANARMAELVAGLEEPPDDGRLRLVERPEVNIAFVTLPPAAIEKLATMNCLVYRINKDVIRLVTSWQTSREDVAAAIERIRLAAGAH